MRLDIQKYKAIFLIVTGVLALLVASPALQRVLVYPQSESFTELWLLGPEHLAENYPYNITRGETYSLFLGLANHLGEAAYYSVQVKFRNQSQPAPDSFNRTPSSIAPLYSVNAFLADKASWELPFTFSFDYSYDAAASKVDFGSLQFNDAALDLDGYSASWDSERSVFFGDLTFEVWLYNSTIGDFQYHERYVDLKFTFAV